MTNWCTYKSVENKPLGFALKIDHSPHPYLTARAITPETASHFGIGFFSGRGSMHDRIVFPICNIAGELVAYAGRAIDVSKKKFSHRTSKESFLRSMVMRWGSGRQMRLQFDSRVARLFASLPCRTANNPTNFPRRSSRPFSANSDE